MSYVTPPHHSFSEVTNDVDCIIGLKRFSYLLRGIRLERSRKPPHKTSDPHLTALVRSVRNQARFSHSCTDHGAHTQELAAIQEEHVQEERAKGTRAGRCTHWIESEDGTCRNPLNPSNKKYCTAHLDELARRVTLKLSPLEATALTLFRKYDLTEAIYDETSRLVESVLHDAAASRHPSIAEVNAWEASQAFQPVMDKLTKSMGKLNTQKC